METSNEELRKVNKKLDPLILEEEFEAEYGEALRYNDEATSMFGCIQAKLTSLQVKNRPEETALPSIK